MAVISRCLDTGVARADPQRLAHRMKHEGVNRPCIAKPHLDLGRVHIGIDLAWIDPEKQAPGRMPVAVQHVGIGLLDRMRQQLVAHEAAIHIEELSIGPRAAGGRHTGQALQPQIAGDAFDRAGGDLVAKNLRDPILPSACRPLLDAAAIDMAAKADVGKGERDATKGIE